MPEPLGIAALLLGSLALFGRPLVTKAIARPRLTAIVLAALAGLLSVVWILSYLRGGPRIIDATAYYLEARAFSEGKLSFQPMSPPGNVMGRFLVQDTLGSGSNMSVIFPPGYPAVLAIGFLFDLPMAIGPILGALAAFLTFELGRAAARAAGMTSPLLIGVIAGGLSVVCGALRYHTADTMSHGLCAVCVAAALLAALRLREGGGQGFATIAGLAVGLCIAARPVSGLALLLLFVLTVGKKMRFRHAARALVAALPFALLLCIHQRLATGAWFVSSQSLYYATSDGPAGCFRYGFGDGIGCLHEHGDFVRHNLKDGYGLVAALGTTLRRLKMHGVDALNAEPLAIVLFVPALIAALRTPALRTLGLALPLFIAAYAPFYFDGNYPGGGARFYADVLPVEHVLVALFAPRAGAWVAAKWSALAALARPETAAAAVVGLSLIGFGLRGHIDHGALRDREGGRPMFRPSDVPETDGALVFVDTDHGFLLGYDPAVRADVGGLEVARFRADDNDAFIWDIRGRPPAYRHRYDVATGWVFVEPFEPRATGRFRPDSFWPALRQRRGFATPGHASAPCAAGERVLQFHPDDSGAFDIEIARPPGGRNRKGRVWFVLDGASARVEILEFGDTLTVEGSASGPTCAASEVFYLRSERNEREMRFVGSGGVALLGVVREEEENR
jgi:hypothetical protein